MTTILKSILFTILCTILPISVYAANDRPLANIDDPLWLATASAIAEESSYFITSADFIGGEYMTFEYDSNAQLSTATIIGGATVYYDYLGDELYSATIIGEGTIYFDYFIDEIWDADVIGGDTVYFDYLGDQIYSSEIIGDESVYVTDIGEIYSYASIIGGDTLFFDSGEEKVSEDEPDQENDNDDSEQSDDDSGQDDSDTGTDEPIEEDDTNDDNDSDQENDNDSDEDVITRVEKLNVTDKKRKSIQLKWPSAGDVFYYEARIKQGKKIVKQDNLVFQRNKKFNGLISNTKYKAQVRSCDWNEVCTKWRTKEFKTKP